MPLLVRKISVAKWAQRNITEGESPSADAITGCMRTSGNTLSLWLIESEVDLDRAVLAIASTFQKVDTIDVATIELDSIREKGLRLVESEGISPYTEFVSNHRDVCELDYDSLGALAELIVESIRNKRTKRYTKNDLRRMICSAIGAGKIGFDSLNEGLREDKMIKESRKAS